MSNPFTDPKRAHSSQRRATQQRHAGMKFCIEGQYVNYEEMAARVGVSFDCIRERHLRLCKKDGPITWEKLGEHL